jgi:hypothetical protein
MRYERFEGTVFADGQLLPEYDVKVSRSTGHIPIVSCWTPSVPGQVRQHDRARRMHRYMNLFRDYVFAGPTTAGGVVLSLWTSGLTEYKSMGACWVPHTDRMRSSTISWKSTRSL